MLKELKYFLILLSVFLLVYFLPFSSPKFITAINEAFSLLQWYAREHTLGCVVPAIFIAGAVSSFLSKESIIRYLGPGAKRLTAYSIASVSGIILAVCSCTVLPMFAGIYAMGAGIGPATAFLYSGPAVNVMAVFLSARVLGWELGLSRIVSAVVFSVLIGLLMSFIFRKDKRNEKKLNLDEAPKTKPKIFKTILFFGSMVAFLLFSDSLLKASILLIAIITMSFAWYDSSERRDWILSTWDFAKMILPLLFIGVFLTGFISSLMPEEQVLYLVGTNSFSSNLMASVTGALWYFATLTEIPITEALIRLGMNKGPALALLLAGPAVSIPSILVVSKVMGLKKTAVFVVLVIVFSTLVAKILSELIF